MAHAFGAIDGHVYTNSLEAFERNYGRGFRVFETDLVRLADGTALLAHPGLEAYVILDSKWSRLEIYQTILGQAPERSLRERILPHIEDLAELNELRTAYPLQNYMVALYHTQAQNRYDDPEAIDFTRRYRAPALMMWWRDRDPSLTLAANGREDRRYRLSFADARRSSQELIMPDFPEGILPA